MKLKIMKILLVLSLLSLLLLTSCGHQDVYLCKDGSLAGDQQIVKKNVVFHCPNGKNTLDYNACTFEKPLKITQDVAKSKAKSFVDGYASASGWQSKLVTTYSQDGDWYAQIILSKRDQTPFQTIVKINGTNGLADCDKNCDYTN